jgi:hypothetical protein
MPCVDFSRKRKSRLFFPPPLKRKEQISFRSLDQSQPLEIRNKLRRRVQKRFFSGSSGKGNYFRFLLLRREDGPKPFRNICRSFKGPVTSLVVISISKGQTRLSSALSPFEIQPRFGLIFLGNENDADTVFVELGEELRTPALSCINVLGRYPGIANPGRLAEANPIGQQRPCSFWSPYQTSL